MNVFAKRTIAVQYTMPVNEEAQKNILGLQLPTDPRWTDLAAMRLEDILTDHAYCEQKAATSCISLIQKNPDKEELVNELAPVVTEEWGHFRLVLQELRKLTARQTTKR
jgi:tRNA-(ms[2]io[6]A)-hydroxylase